MDLRLNTRVGSDITLEELRSKHATLYLGIGAQLGRGLGVPGEEGPSVWTGTDYLARVNCGESVDLGSHVVVVGGGNTAVDAARTARRTGAEVTILYRRSREEMPAIDEEVDDALEEGIDLVLLAAPVRMERLPNGKLVELVACRMELGEPDESGRRRPVPIPDSEYAIRADSVIAAVSQSPILEGFEALDRDGNWLLTDAGGSAGDGLLAGGDALGLGIAGDAIVQGRRAAEELHARLRGLSPAQVKADRRMDGRPPIAAGDVMLDYKPETPAVHAPKLTGDERVAMGAAEVAGTITEERVPRRGEPLLFLRILLRMRAVLHVLHTGMLHEARGGRPGRVLHAHPRSVRRVRKVRGGLSVRLPGSDLSRSADGLRDAGRLEKHQDRDGHQHQSVRQLVEPENRPVEPFRPCPAAPRAGRLSLPAVPVDPQVRPELDRHRRQGEHRHGTRDRHHGDAHQHRVDQGVERDRTQGLTVALRLLHPVRGQRREIPQEMAHEQEGEQYDGESGHRASPGLAQVAAQDIGRPGTRRACSA